MNLEEVPRDLSGYWTCTACGHHTSSCVGGTCTTFVVTMFDSDGIPHQFDHCGCDCVKAATGKSLNA